MLDSFNDIIKKRMLEIVSNINSINLFVVTGVNNSTHTLNINKLNASDTD